MGREPAVHTEAPTRAVSLAIPAKAEYLSLARLALAGICHLTPLDPHQVAELKLGMVEAASGWIVPLSEAEHDGRCLDVRFELAPAALCIDVRGPDPQPVAGGEADLRRAIIEATVDDVLMGPGSVRLVKYLRGPAK